MQPKTIPSIYFDQEDVDISELSLTHYRLTKRQAQQLRLAESSGEYALKPGSVIGTGKPHDPGKEASVRNYPSP
ncbi:MAG: hypothetical protein WA902_20095 [Thermosynechococcaceae cyanobacterium]